MLSYSDVENDINITEKMDNIDESNNIQEIMDSVLEITKKNKSSNQKIRNDLISYLDEIDKKVGSDGELLVKIPSNFNLIAESMNRSDVMGNNSPRLTDNTKPWSQYLLFDSLTKEQNDTEYQGRYKYAFKDDNVSDDDSNKKIIKGLAQIQLLDRQLHEITKRNGLIASEPTKERSVARMTPRSDRIDRNMTVEDITKSVYDHDEPIIEDDLTFLTTKRTGKKKHYVIPYQSTQQQLTSSENQFYNNYEIDDTISNEAHINNETKFTSDNQTAARLDFLLNINNDGELGNVFEPFIDNETRIANREIDEKLATYGRIHRLNNSIDDNNEYHIKDRKELPHNHVNNNTKNKADLRDRENVRNAAILHVNYLKEQRLNRQEKLYSDKVEKLLEKCTKEPLKFNASTKSISSFGSMMILPDEEEVDDEDQSNSYGSSKVRKSNYSVAEEKKEEEEEEDEMVPVFSDVIRRYSISGGQSIPAITSEDIKLLIKNIIAMTNRNNTDTTTTNYSDVSVIDREQINKLLCNYKKDINKLKVNKILASAVSVSNQYDNNPNSSSSIVELVDSKESDCGVSHCHATSALTQPSKLKVFDRQEDVPPASHPAVVMNNNFTSSNYTNANNNSNTNSTNNKILDLTQIDDVITNNTASTLLNQSVTNTRKTKLIQKMAHSHHCNNTSSGNNHKTIKVAHRDITTTDCQLLSPPPPIQQQLQLPRVSNNITKLTTDVVDNVAIDEIDDVVGNVAIDELDALEIGRINSSIASVDINNNKSSLTYKKSIRFNSSNAKLKNTTTNDDDNYTANYININSTTTTNDDDNTNTTINITTLSQRLSAVSGVCDIHPTTSVTHHHHSTIRADQYQQYHLLNNNTIFRNPNHRQQQSCVIRNKQRKEKQVNNILNTSSNSMYI